MIMRKTYFLISFMLIAFIGSAQLVPPMDHLQAIEKKQMSFQYTEKALGDTMGWNTGTPQFGTEMRIMGLVDANDNDLGYWFGSNWTPDTSAAGGYTLGHWAQCYIVDQPIEIAGALAVAAFKENISNSASSVLQVMLYNLAPEDCIIGGASGSYVYGPAPDFYSGTALASASISINDIDTVWAPPHYAWNYFEFTNPVFVSQDFGLIADFTSLVANADTVVFPCDNDGNGLGLHYTQYSRNPAQYYWVSTDFATSGSLNVNMGLFAVLTDNVAIAEGETFYQGMKMTVNPNPVVDMAAISYELQSNSNTNIDIISLNGQVVQNFNLGYKTAGKHTFDIDMNGFASGVYFVSLNAHGSRLIKKIIVE